MKLTLITAMLIASICASAAAQETKSYDFQFGVLGDGPGGTVIVQEETNTLPLLLENSGFRFGYTLRESSGAPFLLKTIFWLPDEPRVILGSLIRVNDTIVSPPQMYHGYAAETFYFNDGDPPGDWQMEVYIDGRLFQIVEFQVIK
jgi:hypothetical protein